MDCLTPVYGNETRKGEQLSAGSKCPQGRATALEVAILNHNIHGAPWFWGGAELDRVSGAALGRAKVTAVQRSSPTVAAVAVAGRRRRRWRRGRWWRRSVAGHAGACKKKQSPLGIGPYEAAARLPNEISIPKKRCNRNFLCMHFSALAKRSARQHAT